MRPTVVGTMMETAELWAQRSTCVRAKMGCVLADPSLETFVIGYNGGYKGGPNTCLGPNLPGQCQCIHAEENAIAKANRGPKIAFITATPCPMCAIRLINAEVTEVYCREHYGNSRYDSNEGLERLESVGVKTYVLRNDYDRVRTSC